MRSTLVAFFLLASFYAQAQRPQLKGGLTNFITNRLIYPVYSAQNCIQGKVNIGFKLNAKGEVYFATITKSVIGDLDEEALRLIRLSSKKWQVPSSHDTTALLVVPVNFILQSSDCAYASQQQIAAAINDYYKEEQLKKVVLNYYKNKEKGLAESGDESKIEGIKDDLGIDDDFLNDKIRMGVKKMKQGDLQGACEEFKFVKYMGSKLADKYLAKYCK